MSGIGEIINDYNENLCALSVVDNSLRRFKNDLDVLQQTLDTSPSSVEVGDEELVINDSIRGRIDLSLNALSEVSDLLRNRQFLLKIRQELEVCMRQAGLERFIQR